jgi:hypothetical protein
MSRRLRAPPRSLYQCTEALAARVSVFGKIFRTEVIGGQGNFIQFLNARNKLVPRF